MSASQKQSSLLSPSHHCHLDWKGCAQGRVCIPHLLSASSLFWGPHLSLPAHFYLPGHLFLVINFSLISPIFITSRNTEFVRTSCFYCGNIWFYFSPSIYWFTYPSFENLEVFCGNAWNTGTWNREQPLRDLWQFLNSKVFTDSSHMVFSLLLQWEEQTVWRFLYESES